MTKPFSWFLCAVLLAACGGGDDSEVSRPRLPIDDSTVAKTVKTRVGSAELAGRVDVVRDKQGVPHIYAATERDAAFGDGWIQAHDRLMQMQVFRYVAAGRLSELFGALQQNVFEGDVTMRTHLIRANAEKAWAELNASQDPTDKAIVAMLEGYADGVNAFVEAQRRREFSLDDAIDMWFDVAKWEPWTPVDTLALGRLQQFSLAYNDFDIDFTRARERWITTFDQAADGTPEKLRAGGFADVFQVTPMGRTPTVDGWPNVAQDSGTRAFALQALPAARAPWVPLPLLDALVASRWQNPLRGPLLYGVGSNNWVVHGSKTASGRPLLANDTHLPLMNPSIWYSVHLVVPPRGADPGMDVEGESFPGVPGVLLGMNQHVSWGATVAVHDLADFYREEIVPCAAGGGDCVRFNGAEVPIQKRTETVKIGAVGTILREKTFVVETVPHHGPILPVLDKTAWEVTPRAAGAGTAVSVRFTGHDVSNEVRTVYKLNHARSRAEAFQALRDFRFGSFNWVIIDDAGDIAWSMAARIPRRPAAAMTYHRMTRRDGTAPFLILPGDGSAEWTGDLDPRYIPHAINPASGFLATANSDPIGETFDGDALNGPMVDGAPLYLSGTYDVGLRTARISQLLEQAIAGGHKLTLEDMERFQADVRSGLGELARPYLASAMTRFEAEIATPGTHADLTALATMIKADAARLARLREAARRIGDWSLDTPAAVAGSPTQAERDDSVATTLFNTWFARAVDGALGDELGRVGEHLRDQLTDRGFVALLAHPELAVTGDALWDDLGTTSQVESRDVVLVRALDGAVNFLAGPPRTGDPAAAPGFDSTDMTTWLWGKVHRLRMDSQVVPNDSLDLPPMGETNPMFQGGFPRHGMNYVLDVGATGLGTDFHYGDGAARRWVCETQSGGGIAAHNALPGGAVFDPKSPHYRDLLDQYWMDNKTYPVPFLDMEVVAAAEQRWVLMR